MPLGKLSTSSPPEVCQMKGMLIWTSTFSALAPRSFCFTCWIKWCKKHSCKQRVKPFAFVRKLPTQSLLLGYCFLEVSRRELQSLPREVWQFRESLNLYCTVRARHKNWTRALSSSTLYGRYPCPHQKQHWPLRLNTEKVSSGQCCGTLGSPAGMFLRNKIKEIFIPVVHSGVKRK